MQKKQLWTTDILVSNICLGTMTRGHQNTENDAHNQLDYAIEHGVNFIDTAEIYSIPPREKTYGSTETCIWNWLSKKWNREKLILATKIAWWWAHTPWIRDGKSYTPDSIRQAVEWSLARLQTDYIDLYQLHRPTRPIPIWGKLFYDDAMREQDNRNEEFLEEILMTFQEIQKSWKVRHFWLSNETPWWVMKFLQIAEKQWFPRIQSMQNSYNLLRREYEVWLSEISLQEECGLLAYSPLAWGMLTGKYQWWAEPPSARYSTWWKKRMPYYTRERCTEAVDEIMKIAEKEWITATQLALSRVNDRVFVTSTIIWATSMKQLKENISSAEIILSQDARDALDDLSRKNSNPACW